MKFPENLRCRFVGTPWHSSSGDPFGVFQYRKNGVNLRIIASSGNDEIPWEHVSVSTEVRCPTWDEMDAVKRLFWDDEQAVMQLHPPRSQWVNNHEHCLHLWRPTGVETPLPPEIAVGIKQAGVLK